MIIFIKILYLYELLRNNNDYLHFIIISFMYL